MDSAITQICTRANFNIRCQCTNTSFLKISLNQADFGCLTNCIACQVNVLEICSNPQKTQQVFKSAKKKKLFLGFCERPH